MVSWSFDEDTGVLRIFGTGTISDYSYDNESENEIEGIDNTRPEFDIFKNR